MVALRIEDVERERRRARPRVTRRAPLRVVAPGASDVLPLVRRDMLPDGVPYRDTGCEINPSCLRCPLARCQFDEPESERRKLILDARDREIAFIRRRHGATIKELASAYGLTRRTVFRIIAERRAAEGGCGTREAGGEMAMSLRSRNHVDELRLNRSPEPKAGHEEHCA